ncbi:hypothetical protein PG995_009122 [Apiospora arundinis]
MGRAKDEMIEDMEEQREELKTTLDDIEAYGEKFECPDQRCESKVCGKACFARSCFDWCLEHSHPSVEERDGETSVTVHVQSRDAEGNLASREVVEKQRLCGSPEARKRPGACRIVMSPFGSEGDFWEFEQDQYFAEVMARDSP